MAKLVKLPGLIDIHVHFRDPGQTEKEDFFTGTSAALAGGFTTVIDMPNNKEPITSLEKLEEKITIASEKTVADIGFHFGSLGDNLDEFAKVTNAVSHPELDSGSINNRKSLVFGIKLYLNQTTGNFIIDEEKLSKIYQAWDSNQPILLHCEDETMQMTINIIRETKRRTHFCHVSSKAELEAIIAAKNEGLPITCGVTPHHLFLSDQDAQELGALAKMKPYLKTLEDVNFLWQNLDQIDIIESDHAPHTLLEKQSENPPFGIPGLETTLPLLLTAMTEGKISLEKIKQLCFENPKEIFNIPTDETTYIEVDLDEEYEIKNEDLKTKAGWTPFAGRKLKGKVKTVYLHGEKVFEAGNILVQPGSGKVIFPS